MAELTLNTDEVVGIKKEIEEGSLELIFNALQSDIYSFPIKSFVRETISNGLDSNIEKNVFKAILGGDPVEKYFLQRQDDMLLKDSEYDPNYYNEQYLSPDDTILVEYIEGNPRDKVIIRDHGVGLGGKRLKGYFKIGWSSKRNFLTARGLYGLGSKAALATGVDYYIMTTVYNGFKTSFMIYNRDYENITPYSADGLTEVWPVTMANNDVINKNIYWSKTHEKNSVTVEVEVKKHNKNTFISAVKDQFQYFNGKINIAIKGTDNQEKWELLNDVPDFESENLLIPKYSTYSSPHILVDGISYGLVSWAELELEDRQGKVALKVTANQVDITQSREALKWTDKTKSTIVRAIHLAEEEASEFVRSRLILEDVEDIFTLNSSFRTISDTSSNSVISTFSKFLQMSSIKPTYTIKLDNGKSITAAIGANLFCFLFYSFDFKKVYTYTDSNKLKLSSELITSFDSLAGATIIFGQESNLGPKLANHILNKYNISSFVYVRENGTRIKEFISLTKQSQDYPTDVIKDYASKIIKKYCALNLDTYDVVYNEDAIDENADIELESSSVNLAKIRKMNKEIVWFTYYYSRNDSYTQTILFNREKHEEKISLLSNYIQGYTTVIVPASYTKLGKMLTLMSYYTKDYNTKYVFVSEDNIKYFEEIGAIHIKNYFRFLNFNTGELMIGQKLVDMNTAYQFSKLKEKYAAFSECSEVIAAITSIVQSKYDSFRYVNTDYSIKEHMSRAVGDPAVVKDIFDYLDTLANFQIVVESMDKDLIAAKAKELFGSDKIHTVYAYDKDYIDSVEAELERISPIGPIISSIVTYDNRCTPLLNLLLKTIHNNS